jgi:hypothetical protein
MGGGERGGEGGNVKKTSKFKHQTSKKAPSFRPKEFKAFKSGIYTAELASQAHHEMDAPNFETASRNVVAKYAEN